MFGLNNKKTRLKNCLGIYLSVEYGVIADVRQEGPFVRVLRSVRVPFNQVKRASGETTKMSSMNAEFMENEAAWAEPLKKALGEGQWSSKKACVALSSQFSVLRHFIMPMIAPRFRKQSIPFESKKYVPFPFEESFYDYYAYSVDRDQKQQTGTKMGVLFALTNKKVSAALQAAMAKMGLELQSIEPAPTAVSRVMCGVGGEPKGPQALAHFNPSTACLTISNFGIPVLFREVNFGDSQSTERRRLDLRGSIDFVNKQFGGNVAVSEVQVSGENLDLWKNLVAEETKLPVSVWDPSKTLGLQEMEWGLLSATGAGAYTMSGYPVEVDLRGTEKTDSDEKTALMIVWSAVGCVFGLLALLCAVQYTKLFLLKRDLKSLQSKTEIFEEFVDRKPDDIKVQVEAVINRSKTFSSVLSGGDYLTPKLESLVNVIPDKVWVRSCNYKSPLRLSANMPSQIDINIAGSAQTGSPQKDIALLNVFMDEFKSQPAIAKVFAPPNGKCDMSTQTGDRSKGVAGQETTFTITCSVKGN